MATGEEIRTFWAQTHAALAKVDMDARVESVESSDPLVMEGGIKTRTICRVKMSSFAGRRMRAWYTVPSHEMRRLVRAQAQTATDHG